MSPAPPSQFPGVWEYLASEDQWCPFAAAANAKLHEGYARFRRGERARCQVRSGEFAYIVDFLAMTQQRADRQHRERPIRFNEEYFASRAEPEIEPAGTGLTADQICYPARPWKISDLERALRTILLMQGTWTDRSGRQWEVSGSQAKCGSAAGPLECQCGAVSLTADGATRELDFLVEGEVGLQSVQWSDGDKWTFARDLWKLEEDRRADHAAVRQGAGAVDALNARLAAQQKLLRMQGTWRDAHGREWLVISETVRSGTRDPGALATQSGAVVLTMGGTTRRVDAIVEQGDGGPIVQWQDGEKWNFARDLWKLDKRWRADQGTINSLRALLQMQGTWRDAHGWDWHVSGQAARCVNGDTGALAAQSGAPALTVGAKTRRVKSRARQADGRPMSVQWDDGETWTFVRDLLALEEQRGSEQAAKVKSDLAIMGLRALLRMQGTWRDKRGQEWHVCGEAARSRDGERGALAAQSGVPVLTVGGETRKAESLAPLLDGSPSVQWDDGGSWVFVRDLLALEEQRGSEQAAKEKSDLATTGLRALLRMQGTWRDKRGRDWHVCGEAATRGFSDGATGALAAQSGVAVLTVGGKTRRVKSCALQEDGKPVVQWDDGEMWTFVQDIRMTEEKCRSFYSVVKGLEALLQMQGTWRDARGQEWHVSGEAARCGNGVKGALIAVSNFPVLTVGDKTRRVKSRVEQADGKPSVQWEDGETWLFVRDLCQLEEQHRSDRLETAGTIGSLQSEVSSLQAEVSAHQTLLRMQGSWRDVCGRVWHVSNQQVRCGGQEHTLVLTEAGHIWLAAGLTSRTVIACTGSAVRWSSGGDGDGGETCWAFVGNLFDLCARFRPCALQYLSAFSLSLASGRCEVAAPEACHAALSDTFLSSVRGHRLRYGSEEWCEAAKIKFEGVKLLHSEHLTQTYFLELARMQESPPPSVAINAVKCHSLSGCKNEYFLFHGAPPHGLNLIKENGFDPRRGGEATGNRFGAGTYFAENASKSDLYTEADETGLRSQLLVRVVLGNICVAKTSMRDANHAPYTDNSKARMFDSVLASTREEGGCVDFREYIVYKASQALPVAQIWYRHLPQCACNLCRRRKGA